MPVLFQEDGMELCVLAHARGHDRYSDQDRRDVHLPWRRLPQAAFDGTPTAQQESRGSEESMGNPQEDRGKGMGTGEGCSF